ncbi:MAG: hypothetical protein ACT4PP_03375 [Sporichthyaceae bacterium]
MSIDIAETPELTPREIYESQTQRCEQVQDENFLNTFVRPHYRGAPADGGTWETEVIQVDGSGAATVRCALDGGHSVFVKVFPFDDGPEVYRKLQALRRAGLGEGSRYQSVEPLVWYDEQKMLICEGATGTDVEALFAIDRTAWQRGIGEAGSWLGRLHSSGLSIGEAHPLLVTCELTSLAKRMAKAAAEQPQHLNAMLANLKLLDSFTHETVDGLLVQSAGQYRAKHVFLDTASTDGGRVTVIDLDRSAPADPARDVAEFIQRMRNDCFELCGDVTPVDAATHDFLTAYVRECGSEAYLANFRFHYARYLVHRFTRVVKKGILGTEEDLNSQFLLTELESLRAGRFA